VALEGAECFALGLAVADPSIKVGARNLRISAHLSTSSKSLLLNSVIDRARVRSPPDDAHAISGGIFDRQRRRIFQPPRSTQLSEGGPRVGAG
jgi:hypothetical protein